MKKCSKCKEPKALEEFYQSKRARDGRRQPCKLCDSEESKLYYKANSEKQKAKARLWYKENPERAKVKANRWKKGNHEKAKAIALRWRAANPEKTKTYAHLWRKANTEKQRASARQWAKANPDKVRAIHQRANKKMRSTPKGRLNNCMSAAMRKSLKNGAKAEHHWETLVNFTVDQLKKHLEKQFEDGMTWDNYGTFWEIDHRIPISVFNFDTPEHSDFKCAWALKNLQPLLAHDNRTKSNKLDNPFQPSLKF